MNLPDYEEAEVECEDGEENPILRFICDNEPADGTAEWRNQLLQALNYYKFKTEGFYERP